MFFPTIEILVVSTTNMPFSKITAATTNLFSFCVMFSNDMCGLSSLCFRRVFLSGDQEVELQNYDEYDGLVLNGMGHIKDTTTSTDLMRKPGVGVRTQQLRKMEFMLKLKMGQLINFVSSKILKK